MNVNAQYETIRLSRIGEAVGITCDSIQNIFLKTNVDSAITFRKRIISIKENRWGEICHIGYSLVPDEVRDSSLSYIYDFVERYLLELDLLNNHNDIMKRLSTDDVSLNGDYPSILDELSSELQVSIESIKYHRYRFNINKGTKKFYMDFSPNCQLILGADDKELEENFSRHFRYYTKTPKDSVLYSLVIDMYGNKRDTIDCTLCDLFNFVEHERCQMVFKQDEDNNDIMYAINEQLDYIHLAILKEKHAYIYTYIPIHIYPEFFIKQIIEEQ